MSVIIVFFLIGAIAFAYWKYYTYVAKYPTGPRPLPIIGNALQVKYGSRGHTHFAEQFGGLFTIFQPAPTVQITDYALIKEAFIDNGEDYVDRSNLPGVEYIFNYCKNGGVVKSSGPQLAGTAESLAYYPQRLRNGQ
ncbi:hypothetical protein PENTCL1PPCAC_30631, partial [Pristionchus entomophagus]